MYLNKLFFNKSMSKTKSYMKIVLMIVLIILGYYNQDNIINSVEKTIPNLSVKENLGQKFEIKYNLKENLSNDIEVKFCPSQECFDILNKSFSLAKSEIKCAFYELDEINLANTILKKSNDIDVELIIDDNYLEEDNILLLDDSNVKIYSDMNRGTRYNNYMHNKFCIIDDKILITGSTNPTTNGFYKNNNNIIKIESTYLAANYENEFDQLASNVYGEKKQSVLEFNNLSLKFVDEEYNISSYMCPQDSCSEKIVNILDKAESEILFATFAITHDDIKDKLIEKSEIGIKIEGLIEKRNFNLKGSDVKEMLNYFVIYNDTNKNNMHHKFFVIDERYVISGSMNPSGSGDDYNDENILIIENSRIAKLYKQEFLRLTN